jgi:hypothetical protein
MAVMNEFVWKKQETIAEVSSMPENVRKVLVIYTGGTIGMKVTAACGRFLVRTYQIFVCVNLYSVMDGQPPCPFPGLLVGPREPRDETKIRESQ